MSDWQDWKDKPGEEGNSDMKECLDRPGVEKSVPVSRSPVRRLVQTERAHPLEFWSMALRLLAWAWWILSSAAFLWHLSARRGATLPAGVSASGNGIAPISALLEVFGILVIGALLYAFSYVLIGIDCLVENTAVTAEAVLGDRELHEEQHADQPEA